MGSLISRSCRNGVFSPKALLCNCSRYFRSFCKSGFLIAFFHSTYAPLQASNAHKRQRVLPVLVEGWLNFLSCKLFTPLEIRRERFVCTERKPPISSLAFLAGYREQRETLQEPKIYLNTAFFLLLLWLVLLLVVGQSAGRKSPPIRTLRSH